jgi:hypothetical protein
MIFFSFAIARLIEEITSASILMLFAYEPKGCRGCPPIDERVAAEGLEQGPRFMAEVEVQGSTDDRRWSRRSFTL